MTILIDNTVNARPHGCKVVVKFLEHDAEIRFFSTGTQLSNTIHAAEVLKRETGLVGDQNKARYWAY